MTKLPFQHSFLSILLLPTPPKIPRSLSSLQSRQTLHPPSTILIRPNILSQLPLQCLIFSLLLLPTPSKTLPSLSFRPSRQTLRHPTKTTVQPTTPPKSTSLSFLPASTSPHISAVPLSSNRYSNISPTTLCYATPASLSPISQDSNKPATMTLPAPLSPSLIHFRPSSSHPHQPPTLTTASSLSTPASFSPLPIHLQRPSSHPPTLSATFPTPPVTASPPSMPPSLTEPTMQTVPSTLSPPPPFVHSHMHHPPASLSSLVPFNAQKP